MDMKSRMKSYYQELNDKDKATYRAKCSPIGFADPYLLEKNDLSKDLESWPPIAHGDIVIYLAFSENPMCTHKEMKAYKELEAYQQFTSGCVQDVDVGYIDDIAVILGKVIHTPDPEQTISYPWILAEKDGPILSTNCTCKAGLAATCVHAAAMMFYLESAVRLGDENTMKWDPDDPIWLLPEEQRGEALRCLPISEIDFSSEKTKRGRFEDGFESDESDDYEPPPRRKIPPPTPEEQHEFLRKLAEVAPNAVVLSCYPEFNKRFITSQADTTKSDTDQSMK